MPDVKRFPIQTKARSHPSKGATVGEPVYMAAYEVYSAIWGPQQALIDGSCRGGFSTGELVAFLYAYGFPRKEWKQRFEEALSGMDIA